MTANNKIKPLIFITNDDGVDAPGIQALIACVRSFARLVVVAPEAAQSGKSHAITLYDPLYLRQVCNEPDLQIYACSGTPVDCVKLGFETILKKEKPVLALSGINHGSNSAISVIYSGTLGAASECSYYQVPSLGLSLISHDTTADMTAAVEYSRRIIREILEKHDRFPRPFCLNVNVPDIPMEQIKGVRLCRQNRGTWVEEFERHTDSQGRDYYCLKGYFDDHEEGRSEDTDQWALNNGYVSVVPTEMSDLTDYRLLDTLREHRLDEHFTALG